MNITKNLPIAKRALGQNFLQDQNICRKIVGCLQLNSSDHVLEIGPGPGALTNFIHAASPELFVAVEKDNFLAAQRANEVPSLHAKRFFVINYDALLTPWDTLTSAWKIIGNLPYNIASPLMWDIFSKAPGLTRAVFMVQKEVGLRLVARPSTSAYGALSVWIQSFVTPKIEFIVPPHVFVPRPKIDSAVLSFIPNQTNEKKFDPNSLAWLLKASFQKRRKQLGSIFRQQGLSLQYLELAGIDKERRPETLSVLEFHRLSDTVKAAIRD